MRLDQQRLADYLDHILKAIERIDRYTEDMDEVAFLDNEMVQDAVIRNIEIIGEASNNIEKHFPQFAADHSELPLSFAYQMRNAVAHGYFKVDLEIVWKQCKTTSMRSTHRYNAPVTRFQQKESARQLIKSGIRHALQH